MNPIFLENLIIPVVTYVAGITTGFFLRGVLDRKGSKQESNFVLFAVTIIWVLSMLVDIASPNYETSTLVHGLMGAIVGFFYKFPKLNRK